MSYERFVVNFVCTIVDRVTSLFELYILLLQVSGRGLIIVADELRNAVYKISLYLYFCSC